MTDPTQSGRVYKVEISGWDAEEKFFVEQTQLEWNELNEKKVVMRNRVTRGAMVFLRLAESVNTPSSLAVAFRAGQIQAGALLDTLQVQLEQLWPWQGEHVKPAGPGGRARAETKFHEIALNPEIEVPTDLIIH